MSLVVSISVLSIVVTLISYTESFTKIASVKHMNKDSTIEKMGCLAASVENGCCY